MKKYHLFYFLATVLIDTPLWIMNAVAEGGLSPLHMAFALVSINFGLLFLSKSVIYEIKEIKKKYDKEMYYNPRIILKD